MSPNKVTDNASRQIEVGWALIISKKHQHTSSFSTEWVLKRAKFQEAVPLGEVSMNCGGRGGRGGNFHS